MCLTKNTWILKFCDYIYEYTNKYISIIYIAYKFYAQTHTHFTKENAIFLAACEKPESSCIVV